MEWPKFEPSEVGFDSRNPGRGRGRRLPRIRRLPVYSKAMSRRALNTRALQLAAYQQLIERISEFNLITIQSPDLRSVEARVRSGAALSPDEAAILNAFLYLAYRIGDPAYLQFQQGIIDEQRLRSGLGLLVNFLELPLTHKHWEGARQGWKLRCG